MANVGRAPLGRVYMSKGAIPPSFVTLESSDNSITFVYTSTSIDITVTGGSTVGETITGDTGGAISPISGNWNLNTANTTGKFLGTSGTLTLNFLPVPASTTILIGTSNPGNSANDNTGLGSNALNSITTGQANTAMGSQTLVDCTSGSQNTSFGFQAGGDITTGNNNTSYGANCMINVKTGSGNLSIGVNSGNSYTTSESSNIVIGDAGVISESNVIRIGTQGSGALQQNKCFLAGIVGVTVSNTQSVTIDSTTGQLGVTAFASSASFGDGSDSTQTFDGTTVILGLTPSANVYTLNRDIFLASSTVNNGVTINTNGYRIFCSGILTNNGTIAHNGNNGANSGTAGAALSVGLSSINTGSTLNALGTAGGAGNTGAGSNGVTGNNISTAAYGGSGGAGGAGGSGGGTGGILTTVTATQGNIRALPWAIMGQLITGALAFIKVQGGAGGGGGGGDGVVAGGGGGSGGGIVILASLFIAGTGSIRARGGNGGSPASGTNVGGGASGGGGLVIVVSRSISSGAIAGQTIDANPGTPGTHQGSGSDGGNGNNGTVILLPN